MPIARSGYKCDSLATNINTIRIGDKIIRKVSFLVKGCNAPAIEKIYPLSADKILNRKYNIKNWLVSTIPVFVTILPTKNTAKIDTDNKKLGIRIE